MNKYRLFEFFLLVCLASCAKEAPVKPPPSQESKLELLTQRRWKIKSFLIIKNSGDTLKNVRILQSENWRISFNPDSTGNTIGTIMRDGFFSWRFTNFEQTSLTITKGGSFNYTLVSDSLLKGVIPNLNLTLVDSLGNPVESITGTLNETYNRE